MSIADVLRKIWQIYFNEEEQKKLEEFLAKYSFFTENEFDFESISITPEQYEKNPKEIIERKDGALLLSLLYQLDSPNFPEGRGLCQKIISHFSILYAFKQPGESVPGKSLKKVLPHKTEGAIAISKKAPLSFTFLSQEKKSNTQQKKEIEGIEKVDISWILKTICETCIKPKDSEKARKLIEDIESTKFQQHKFEVDQISLFKEDPKALIENDSTFLSALLTYLRIERKGDLANELIQHFSEEFVNKFNFDMYKSIPKMTGGYGYLLKEINGLTFVQLKRRKIGQEQKEAGLNESERAKLHEHGWKIHLSVNDDDSNNLKKAWPIILKLAFKYQLPHFKIKLFTVQKKSHLPDSECLPQEKGKQLTFYCGENPSPGTVKKLSRFCQELTEEFKKNDIQAGQYGENVRYVNEYVGYKNDFIGENEYRKPDERGYKLKEQPDLFRESFKDLISSDFPPVQYKTPHYFCLLDPNKSLDLKDKKIEWTIYLQVKDDEVTANFIDKKGKLVQKKLNPLTPDDLAKITLYSDKAIVSSEHRELAEKISRECGFSMVVKEKLKLEEEVSIPPEKQSKPKKITPSDQSKIKIEEKEKSFHRREKASETDYPESVITSPRRTETHKEKKTSHHGEKVLESNYPKPSSQYAFKEPGQPTPRTKSMRSKSIKGTKSQGFKQEDLRERKIKAPKPLMDAEKVKLDVPLKTTEETIPPSMGTSAQRALSSEATSAVTYKNVLATTSTTSSKKEEKESTKNLSNSKPPSEPETPAKKS